jgi:hypothetical protein
MAVNVIVQTPPPGLLPLGGGVNGYLSTITIDMEGLPCPRSNCRSTCNLLFASIPYTLKGKPNEAGLRQIYENGYAEPYKGLNRKLLLGIGFDPKKRVVSDWKLELYCQRS